MDTSISQIALKDLLEKNIPIAIIDVRDKEEFEALNLPRSMNIPLEQLEKLLPFLSNEFQYVTVCGKGGGRSMKGSELLTSAGLNAKWLTGGTFAWYND